MKKPYGYILLRCLIGICTKEGPMELWFLRNITSTYTPYNFFMNLKLLRDNLKAF